MRCPCGSGETFAACCGARHDGSASAPTAEALMRSRYSAFAVRDGAYLLRSWHPSTRPSALELGDERWTGLEILRRSGGLFDDTGTVEFRAHFRADGRDQVLHEHSRFVREEAMWFYVEPV